MLSILHRYVYRDLARSFVLSFLVLTATMLLGAVYRPLRQGLGFRHLMQFLPYTIPYLLAWVVPASMLAACVMTYGRLSAGNELTATRVSGVPLRYMCYPAVVLAAVLTAATVPLNNWVIPLCKSERRRAFKEAFFKDPFRISMMGGHETIELGDHKVYVERIEGDVLHNVVVIAPRKPKAEKAGEDNPDRHKFAEQHPEVYAYRARKARYMPDFDNSRVQIVLEDAEYTIVTPERNARNWLTVTLQEQVLAIPVESPVEELHERRRSYLSRAELVKRAAEVRARRAELVAQMAAVRARKAEGAQETERAKKLESLEKERIDLRARLARTLAEVHLRGALSAATFALALVGVPLGIWIRRESRLASFAVALLVFLLLYALIAGGEGMAVKERLPPALALWTPDALTAGLGVGLLLRASRH